MISTGIESESSEEQVVNPYEVSAKAGEKIDYDKLIDKFGCQRIDNLQIDRVRRLTCREPHEFLRRGVFFAHRDFNELLDAYERGEKFYLYTGRGPSSESLHLGHLIPFMFTKYLQEAFKVPLVIQLTDDEKFMWKKDLSVEETKRLARENAKDIIACGFDVTKTFIFSDFDYLGGAFYENIVRIGMCLTYNKAREIFGFSNEDYIGKLSFPLLQAAPSFPSSFPELFPNEDNLRCLIPCSIDQDSSFQMARDFAPPLGYRKPILIESSFLPPLQGVDVKISTSDPNYPNSTIFMTDTAKDIAKKINNSFSGGKEKEKQKELGANLKVDIPFKYLSFFLEDDDELERIKNEYGEGEIVPKEGKMQTGNVKKKLIGVLTELVEKHRKARADVTDQMVDEVKRVRALPTMFRSRESKSSEKKLNESLIDRVKRLTCREPHVFLRRGIFSSHEDFNEILDAYEKRKEMFYLYTGIRNSSGKALHLGHLVPLMFTKYLQEAFDVPLVIQLNTDDDEKKLSVKETQRLESENVKDIMACGFDVTKTFVFSGYDHIGGDFCKNIKKVGDCVTINKARAIFGFTDEDPIAKYIFPSVQAAPSFPSSFPHLFSSMNKNLRCLIPCAIDQDPYFRMTRDAAPRLGYSKPSLIESIFFPSLQGLNKKMSASDRNSAIYVTDTAEDIANKIDKYAFSSEHRDLEEDIPFQYLSFFFQDDDDELERIRKEYGEGNMNTGEVKKKLIQVLTKIVERHCRARAAVSDEMVDAFMDARSLPTMFE